ncbi:MAG: hypothetical protein ABEK59_03410 [Halobacteria archaeon]
MKDYGNRDGSDGSNFPKPDPGSTKLDSVLRSISRGSKSVNLNYLGIVASSVLVYILGGTAETQTTLGYAVQSLTFFVLLSVTYLVVSELYTFGVSQVLVVYFLGSAGITEILLLEASLMFLFMTDLESQVRPGYTVLAIFAVFGVLTTSLIYILSYGYLAAGVFLSVVSVLAAYLIYRTEFVALAETGVYNEPKQATEPDDVGMKHG